MNARNASDESSNSSTHRSLTQTLRQMASESLSILKHPTRSLNCLLTMGEFKTIKEHNNSQLKTPVSQSARHQKIVIEQKLDRVINAVGDLDECDAA